MDTAEIDERHIRLAHACNRLCDLMGWAPKTTHKWMAIRKIAMGQATAISTERIEEICHRIAGIEPARAAGEGE